MLPVVEGQFDREFLDQGSPRSRGENLNYLLRLCKLVEHTSLPPMWKTLEDLPKRQQITALQRAFDDISQRMVICAPIIATPSLFNISLALVFFLNHRDELRTGIHQLCLGNQTSAAWKVLKARIDQHQVIAGGGGAPMMDDAASL